MFATPSEILSDRTIKLWEDTAIYHVPVWVTGRWHDEPAHTNTQAGHLPDLMIPVVGTYADGSDVPETHVLTVARVLAAQLYGVTREGISPADITARPMTASMVSLIHGWYIAQCPKTGVPFVVYEPHADVERACDCVVELYEQDHHFAGIAASKTVRPLDLKIF